jgi:hypothetical protein
LRYRSLDFAAPRGGHQFFLNRGLRLRRVGLGWFSTESQFGGESTCRATAPGRAPGPRTETGPLRTMDVSQPHPNRPFALSHKRSPRSLAVDHQTRHWGDPASARVTIWTLTYPTADDNTNLKDAPVYWRYRRFADHFSIRLDGIQCRLRT